MNWKEGYKILAFLIIIISFMLLRALIYNQFLSNGCKTDKDCAYIENSGSHNSNFLRLNLIPETPQTRPAWVESFGICEQRSCTTFQTTEAASESDCTRLEHSSSCYYSLAKNKKDPKYCDKIDGLMGDWCYTSLSIDLLDPTLCSKILDSTEKENCLANFETH